MQISCILFANEGELGEWLDFENRNGPRKVGFDIGDQVLVTMETNRPTLPL